jgi:hypothetical protein
MLHADSRMANLTGAFLKLFSANPSQGYHRLQAACSGSSSDRLLVRVLMARPATGLLWPAIVFIVN